MSVSRCQIPNVRCKGLSLKNENAQGLISKNLMREFLHALAQQEKREIRIPQHRFQILRNSFKIQPLNYFKKYNNENLLQKRLYNTQFQFQKLIQLELLLTIIDQNIRNKKVM